MGQGVFTCAESTFVGTSSNALSLDTASSSSSSSLQNERNTPLYDRKRGGGFASLANSTNAVKTLEQTQREKMGLNLDLDMSKENINDNHDHNNNNKNSSLSIAIAATAAIAKDNKPSPIKATKRPPLHNNTNKMNVVCERQNHHDEEEEEEDEILNGLNYSTSPKTTQLLYMQSSNSNSNNKHKPLDTPMKIQLQYYLNRHLSRGGSGIGSGKQ